MNNYEIKLIGGVYFTDYWNLSEHPLYVTLDKKQKPYFRFNEIATEGYVKINCLQALKIVLDNHDWCYENRYWEKTARQIQAAINIPYTELS